MRSQTKFSMIILFFLLAALATLALSACSPNQPISPIPTTPSKTEVIAVPPVEPTPIVTVISFPPTDIPPTVVPTSVPKSTLEPTPNLVYDPQAQADRINFAPYATWAELNSTVSANQPKRFVLSAMQYQVMSVSIAQGAPFVVEIAGEDKKVLTDANNPHFYWRGGLPSTQDYYITVTSQVEGPFNLRVAINPPGLAYQHFETVNSQYDVSLGYSDEFAPVSWELPFTTKGTPLLNLYFIEPSFYFPTTNLNEAAVELTATQDPAIVATCTQPAQPGETSIGAVTVNGHTFTQSEFIGAAAGNQYDQLFYRTVYKDKCFEVIFLIHSSNIGNYPPGTVVEYDRERLMHKFETDVLSTFTTK